jgi:CHAT domain-containing protein
MRLKIRVDLPRRRGYQCRMFETRPKSILVTLVLLIGMVTPALARSAESDVVTAERPAEYMIYQYPDSILVLKIDVREAEFSVRTTGPESAQIKTSSVPGRRIGPVYQYIDATELPRQLMIEVTPGRALDRSAISLEVIQFSPGDQNTAPLARAYQMLSLGTEATHSADAATWASKAYSLRNAAGIFASLGREEMRLWSEYFAAHLVLHQLADPLMASELAAAVQDGAARAGFGEVELAARTLEVEAVLKLAAGSGERSAPIYYDRAHQLLSEVAALAERLALSAERGRALFQDARVYEMQGEPERALDQYRAALDITTGAGDAELLNQIRASAAAVYESLGRTTGAIAMLDDMADDLGMAEQENADLELAAGLFEKGRLLNVAYRYPEAATELTRALELQQVHAEAWIWGPTGLELAWSYYASGDTDQALRLLEASLPVTRVRGNKHLLVRAYASLGNIHRERREFEKAAAARMKQSELVGDGPGHAASLLEAALDAILQGGAGAARAPDLLRRGRQAALEEGDGLSAQRAILYLCLLDSERNQETSCGGGDAATAYDSLRNSGIPRVAADAALTRARTQLRLGAVGAARESMEQLIDELHWYRRTMPGVLGAWYAENHDELAQEYLALEAARSPGRGAAMQDGKGLLLAMERVRRLEAADYARPGGRPLDAADDELLRGILARREAAPGDEATGLAAEANRLLTAARQKAVTGAAAISEPQLERLLQGLARSEAVLSYYFAGERSLALVARRDGVQEIELPGTGQIEVRLEQLRDALKGPESSALRGYADALGRSLLKPLDGMLPEKVYLLPVGPLRGVPLDVLRLDGAFFAERHSLVNLASLDSIERRAPVLTQNFQDRVFLAGNPQEQDDPFSLEFRASPEVTAVTEQFVGPGLHIVQGVALQKDEFQDDRFTQASLIHLALAGTLDLAFPDRSRLFLAPVDASHADASSRLLPADVRRFDLVAQLVVLSGTAIAGESRSLADSRLAFVADFLEAGSRAVVVSYRPAGESVNGEFTTDLYRRLLLNPDIETALANAKRALIGMDSGTNLPQWAGFQLFIR